LEREARRTNVARVTSPDHARAAIVQGDRSVLLEVIAE
jgi:hypothetical protein